MLLNKSLYYLRSSIECFRQNTRRGDIVNEIRTHEEKLKAISQTIEEDSKVRDQVGLTFNSPFQSTSHLRSPSPYLQLRLMQKDQDEIDMIHKQIRQERDILKEKVSRPRCDRKPTFPALTASFDINRSKTTNSSSLSTESGKLNGI